MKSICQRSEWDTRKTLTRGMLLEIKGPERKEQAKVLAKKIEEVLSGTGARVSMPSKTAELRLHRIEESVTREEVIDAVAAIGECEMSDITAGPLRLTHYGLCTTLVRCPLDIVPKLVKGGYVKVEWSSARMEVLPTRK